MSHLQPVAQAEVVFLVRRRYSNALTCEYQYPAEVTAPVAAGDRAGEVVVRAGDQEVGRFPVFFAQEVEEAGFWGKLWDLLR